MLHVDKVDTLITEKIQISASGLEEFQCYKFQLIFHYEFGSFHSFCVCRSDESGAIDLSRDKPIRGTYHEADSMGLFISLQPSDEVDFGHYVKNDSAVPFFYTLKLITESEEVIDKVHLKKHWTSPFVTQIEVSQDGLYGILFKPPGPGPFPCILSVPGVGGRVLNISHASAFSANGFLVYNFASFGHKDLPDRLQDADFELYTRHIRFIQSLPYFSGKLGLYGLSLSGTISNYIAAKHPEISAVISVNGPEAFYRDEAVMKDHGKDLECETLNVKLFTKINGITNQKASFLDVFSRLKPETSIKWEHISKDTTFRIVASIDDFLLCGATNGTNVKNHLLRTGHQVEIDFIPGGHVVSVPYFPHQPFTYNKFVRLALGLGGECILQTKAHVKVWENHVKFWMKHLGTPPVVPDYERETEIILPSVEKSKL